MRAVILCVVLLVLCIHWLEAKDLVVGTRINNLLISTEKVVYNGIPLIRRDKDYIYTDPKQSIIKGIIARDLSRTDADVTVTAGGVGDSHVTLHFRGERGAKDFGVGSRINNLLISTEKIFHRRMPFITKDKDYIYTDPNKRIIKCVIARDLSATDTDVTVTAGGVGDTHVTLHFRGERGAEIRYLVLIFSNDI